MIGAAVVRTRELSVRLNQSVDPGGIRECVGEIIGQPIDERT